MPQASSTTVRLHLLQVPHACIHGQMHQQSGWVRGVSCPSLLELPSNGLANVVNGYTRKIVGT